MARIYIADDDGDIRHLLTFALIEEGHEVLAAKDGAMALEAVIADPPDVLVLDMMMPRLNGFQVLDELTRAGKRETTRVLILTARSSEKDRVEGFDHGADLYLTKPFEPDEFVQAVRDLLESSHDELKLRREAEKDKANLLAQLESAFQSPS
jgi:two-component system response regulator MprA